MGKTVRADRACSDTAVGAYFRPRIRRRALRAPSLDPRTFPNVALRAVRLPLVESGLIVRINLYFKDWVYDGLSIQGGFDPSNFDFG